MRPLIPILALSSAIALAALPPQKMSPVPAVALPPPVPKTNIVLSWDYSSYQDFAGRTGSTALFMTEIWECFEPAGPDIPELYQLVGYSDSNSFTVPETNAWLTSYGEVRDTNGVFIGWTTNHFSCGYFMTVGTGYFGLRVTNVTKARAM